MSVAKVIELTSTSAKSFEGVDAEGDHRARAGRARTSKALGFKERKVVVTDGESGCYRVNMLVTFVLGGDTSI